LNSRVPAVELVGGVAQRVTELMIDPAFLGLSLVIGVGSSIVAAWVPARGAARTDPVRAIQKGTYQIVSTVENRWRARLASGFFIFSFLGLFSDSRFVFYAALISMLFAALLLTPWLSLLLSKALRPVLRRTFPIEGTLAADSLISAPRRTSATVGALMLSLTLVVVFGGFIGALYESVDQWLDSEFNADFFVSTSANLTARSATFPAELGAVIERVEGVEQVQLVRNARITFRRVPVLVMAIETAKAAGRSKQSVVAGDRHEMNRLTASGKGTIVSQSFAYNSRAQNR
jgi:putative ABC transport system permease protein